MLKIFLGKKKEYNQLILKALIFGPKRTQELAHYIFDNSPTKNRNIDGIRSVISRQSDNPKRNGRLQELSNKEYIKRNENREWNLTYKGLGVSLSLYDNIDDVIPFVATEMKDNFKKIRPLFEKILNSRLFSKLTDDKSKRFEIVDLFEEEITSKEFLEYLRKISDELNKTGVDLESMNDKEYSELVFTKFAQEKIIKKLFSFLL